MNWLIKGILRTEPIDDEFERLDKLDEQMILDSEGSPDFFANQSGRSKCHILSSNGQGDFVTVSYFGYMDIANTCDIQRLETDSQQMNDIAVAIVKIHNPVTGWIGYGASQSEFSNVAEQKAYRNAVRLSLRPSVFREYSKRWIKRWVSEQYSEVDNLELANRMYPKEKPFDTAMRIYNKAKLKSLDGWQVRYILLREIKFGTMAVRKPKPMTERYNRYKVVY